MSNEIGIAASNSKSASQWDSSYSVRAYSTYYYTRYEKDGYAYHDITSCSGGWSRSDSSVTMSQRKVIYGASGPSYPNGSYVQQNQTMYPTSNSFSYTAPSSWVAVKTTHAVGVSTWVTLNRGGSTWTLKLINQN
ncbi:hypothetical protein [uncultured Metabacillus sp.]|uniref:hypothetical protein n=1 Tax=uncultured Metabacillus sp. TaxID=2860135 RepID=UPI00261B6A05|nr:hypothetical protein [uncultured Metabacillus sp.]